MEQGYRKTIIKTVTFLGGLYYFLDFILPPDLVGFEIGKYDERVSKGFVLVGSMAVGLGLINLLWSHGSRIIFRRKGAAQSIALLLGLFLMLFFSLQEWFASEQISARSAKLSALSDYAALIKKDQSDKIVRDKDIYVRSELLNSSITEQIRIVRSDLSAIDSTDPQIIEAKQQTEMKIEVTESSLLALKAVIDHRSLAENLDPLDKVSTTSSELAASYLQILMKSFEQSLVKHGFTLLLDGLFTALGSAMFSLLGFYIVSAAYRAFRIRSLESALMMSAAVVVMLGQIPFGLMISPHLPEVRLWLLQVPNTAAFRAIAFGASIAALIMSIRMWFSIESENFGESGRGKE